MAEARRFFSDQSLEPESELRTEDVPGRYAYVVAVYENGQPDRLEVMVDGSIDRVIYLNGQPSADILTRHQQQYPQSPFVIRGFGKSSDGLEIQEDIEFSAEGQLSGTVRHHFQDGETIFIEYLDADGEIMRRDEFERTGEDSTRVRVYDKDGKLLYEEPDDDEFE